MRYSQAFIPTQREIPSEAELISHRLLLRAGYMRKLASGVYSWLPLGRRVLRRIAALVREESERAGAQEVLFPALQPLELWEETGRTGMDVLFRLQDRSRRDLVLGMTHEEVATDLIRSEVRSYRQLPLLLYQVQIKFRDEPRPRGGVLRCREFMMHDCYSFHASQECLDRAYGKMRVAYARALARMGLDFVTVEADPDGFGSTNHRFVTLVDSGEDLVFLCDSCGYAADSDRCELGDPGPAEPIEADPLKLVRTPGMRTVEEVTAFLQVPAEKLIKTLLYCTQDGDVVAALVRGDRDLNEAKLERALGGVAVEMAPAEVVERITGAPVGFAGPQGLEGVRIIADRELQIGGNWVAGANQADAHVLNVNAGRDFQVDLWADLRAACDGDPCPRCGGELEALYGIEMAHIFQIGTRFSEAMGAYFQDAAGQERPVYLGSYGLGVSRAVAAIAEQNADVDGLLWPATVAPFDATVVCLNAAQDIEVAEEVYGMLQQAGISVLLDDRDERAGVKFKDADLIGIPLQIVVGRGAQDGWVELRVRGRDVREEVAVTDIAERTQAMRRALIWELDRAAAEAEAAAH